MLAKADTVIQSVYFAYCVFKSTIELLNLVCQATLISVWCLFLCVKWHKGYDSSKLKSAWLLSKVKYIISISCGKRLRVQRGKREGTLQRRRPIWKKRSPNQSAWCFSLDCSSICECWRHLRSIGPLSAPTVAFSLRGATVPSPTGRSNCREQS